MVHCWGDLEEEFSDEGGSWRQQRLYTSGDGYQRLCDIVEKVNEKETKVKFARCQQEKVVPNERLRWPDFSSVDQKWDPYTKCTMEWWHSVVPNLGSEFTVVEPDYEALHEAHDEKLEELQRSLCEGQVYPSGPIVGTLMWDQKVHKFCVRTKPADDALSIAQATLNHSPADCSFAAKLESELQLPHYYEGAGCWMYQHLRVSRKVDLNFLRQLIYDQYQEVEQGHDKAPKLIIRNNKARGTQKFYPVTDGEGGSGVVFDNYHAAREYLGIWDGSSMLKACNSEIAAQETLAGYSERRAPAPPRSAKRKTPARVNAKDIKLVKSKTPVDLEDDDMDTMVTVWKDSLKPVVPAQLVRHLVPETMTTTDKPFDPREPAQLVYSPLDLQHASCGHEREEAGNQWLDIRGLRWLKIQPNQTVLVVRYRKTTDGNLKILAGEGNTLRGVGMMFIDNKVKQKYIRSVAHSMAGYLCLGGQSRAQRNSGGHLGLPHTLEQHFEDIQDGEKVAQDIMEHIYTDGSRKVGNTVHVLKMRAHPNVKNLYYIFEDEEYCRQEGKIVDLSFNELYLLENHRKFNALRWVSHLEVTTIHREPLSLFAQLLREEPEVESRTQPSPPVSDTVQLLVELEERAEIAEEKVEELEGALAKAEDKAKELEETLAKDDEDVGELRDMVVRLERKVEARNEVMRKSINEKLKFMKQKNCALERATLLEWDLKRHRAKAVEQQKDLQATRSILEGKLEAVLKNADELNEENKKLRGQAQNGQQVEETGICFTYPDLEETADSGDLSFPPQDVRKQKTGQRSASAVSKKRVQPSVVVDTNKKTDFHQSRRTAAPGGSDQ
ncbi:hypothetical protein CYMTET_41459 [Cymbomonas tetramitiformis]|uniref:Uncharacterized protein n=1 Tax=Cymbomonas tetramitiformis TaxID=36881 RepID=A0AAE0C607_9CHLO|nr:hypothetical protein CYMTET_42884 [Cymbomonas tetramitiformis]KAK3249101.1 hypothetical protein CYMTET_41459 [Cymbomonas tetramitiformis]